MRLAVLLKTHLKKVCFLNYDLGLIDKVYTFVYTFNMNTQFIGIKDFRQKIAEYARKASETNTRYIVVSHKKPLFEVTPFAESETLDSFFAEIIEAKKDVAEGRVYSEEDIIAMLA